MLKIGIIVGSTRPGRKAAAVAKWVHDILKSRKDAEFEIVDIEDYKLPLLDEPLPPTMHQYRNAHTKTWSEKIASLDAYIFVTPEYNHATSAALKNAIDFLYHEWNNKVAGFVGYGGAGGVRAVENLRLAICCCARRAGADFGGPIRRSNCALAWSGASSCLWSAAKKDRHGERAQQRRQGGGDSDPDRELDRRVIDRVHDSTNHKIIHRKRKGAKQCHTLQSEKKTLATSSFTTKTMARANRLF